MKPRLMNHSVYAAAVYLFLSPSTPNAIAKASSTKMNVSLIQKLARKTRYSRKCIPSRWYSAPAVVSIYLLGMRKGIQMKIALMMKPAMKTTSMESCTRWCRFVSKIVSRIKPAAPMMAKPIANPAKIFSVML